MNAGDDILIVEGDTIRLLGKIALKTIHSELSASLWKNIRGESSEGWDLIYFIANPREIDLPFAEFKRLFDYRANWQLRGFTNVSEDKLNDFYSRYDDLYSILIRLKMGEEAEEMLAPSKKVADEPPQEETYINDREPQEEPKEVLSDHVRMQWKLLSMGHRAGEQVWAPKNDQGKIKEIFEFNEFEESFAAGLDTQTKYVENIDVVWKEEFRIDAAFEIENSTAIYSGLLRFADLAMVAPNTIYPLFIVAPSSKRYRITEQLSRPSFKHLNIVEKVRYLSYEKVDEIDDFFSDSAAGLNASVLMDKAEQLGSN